MEDVHEAETEAIVDEEASLDEDIKSELIGLGERLFRAGPDKFFEVLRGLRDVVEAQEIIARFDHQLLFRGRPKKVYRA